MLKEYNFIVIVPPSVTVKACKVSGLDTRTHEKQSFKLTVSKGNISSFTVWLPFSCQTVKETNSL